MCRLLAYVSKDPGATVNRLADAMLEFRKLAVSGCVPCGSKPGHEDGWGLSAYKHGAPALYYRSVQSAAKDPQFKRIVEAVRAMEPETVLLHLRKTSAGSNVPANTQPFVSDLVTLCQNGTMYMPKSTASDTLRFFREVISAGADAKAYLQTHRRFARKFQMSAMNMFFCDGEQLVVVQHFNAKYPDAEKLEFPKYYTLHEMADAKSTFICSEKLDALSLMKDTPLVNRRFYRYRNGRRVGMPEKI